VATVVFPPKVIPYPHKDLQDGSRRGPDGAEVRAGVLDAHNFLVVDVNGIVGAGSGPLLAAISSGLEGMDVDGGDGGDILGDDDAKRRS
jgi:hypothetical protein